MKTITNPEKRLVNWQGILVYFMICLHEAELKENSCFAESQVFCLWWTMTTLQATPPTEQLIVWLGLHLARVLRLVTWSWKYLHVAFDLFIFFWKETKFQPLRNHREKCAVLRQSIMRKSASLPSSQISLIMITSEIFHTMPRHDLRDISYGIFR